MINSTRAALIGIASALVLSGCSTTTGSVQAVGTARLARLGREDLAERLAMLERLMDFGGGPLLA